MILEIQFPFVIWISDSNKKSEPSHLGGSDFACEVFELIFYYDWSSNLSKFDHLTYQ